MTKTDLRKLAKKHCIFNASLSTTEVIRAIQLAEGNFDCFARADSGQCDQMECAWRHDCLLDSTQGAMNESGRKPLVKRSRSQRISA